MEAVILVGGQGTRLRPLTLTRPKPLLPIADRPMVEHLLSALPDAVDHVFLAAGYRIDDLAAWARGWNDTHDLTVEVIEETEPLGTGGAIRNAAHGRVTGPFFALNGDVLTQPPLEAQLELLRKEGARGVLSLMSVDDPSRFGVADLDGDRIRAFVEKPDPGEAPSNLVSAGAYALRPDVLDLIPDGEMFSIERGVWPVLAEEGTLRGVPYEGMWVDCGTPEAFLEAHAELLGTEVHLGADAALDGDRIGWASLGAGALVEKGATLTNSVLLDGARVHAGAEVVNSILGENAIVGDGARVVNAVLGDSANVQPGAELHDGRLGPKEVLA